MKEKKENFVMMYIEVERIDHAHDRYEYEQYALPTLTDPDDIPFLAKLCDDFDAFVKEGQESDYTEDQLDEYLESCEWFWYEIEEDEYFCGGRE